MPSERLGALSPVLRKARRWAGRFRPSVLIGATWATLAFWGIRRRLKSTGVKARVKPPLWLPTRAGPGVGAALRRWQPTCLERALVHQAWLTSRGTDRDVVIGVPHAGMANEPAHAWVDGYDLVSPSKYLELHRLAAPLVGTGGRDEQLRAARERASRS